MRRITEAEALTRAFYTGKADEKYVRCDWDAMWLQHEPTVYESSHPKAYRAAYLLGFFSSYENHEIGPKHKKDVQEAYSTWRFRMALEGIDQKDR